MQETNDNFSLRGPKLLDERSGKELAGVTIPFDSVAEANSSILEAYRCEGLTVLISDGVSNVEYWWKDGTEDGDLVEKRGDSSGTETLTNKTIGDKIRISTGANSSVGTSTLVGGTVTINTTQALTGSIIMLSRNTPGGTIGDLSAPSASIVNATSFVINSVSATDTSTINWVIIN